ncbi:MAG: trypsin-like peptidase domain-containing protein [Clostridiales bacterium]|nr:trypsin-like peptidase domain-containing protein [Clostridiales bacterium]
MEEQGTAMAILLFALLVLFLFRKSDIGILAWVVVTAGTYVLCGKHLAAERQRRRETVALPWTLAGFGVLALTLMFGGVVLSEHSSNEAREYNVQGHVSFREGDFEEAVKYFSEAVKIDQDHFYLSDYAIALARNGEDKKAEEILRQLQEKYLQEYLQDDEEWMKEETSRIRAEIYFARGQYEEVIDTLLHQAETGEMNFAETREAMLLCARAYEKMGDEWLDEEIKLLEKGRNFAGDDFTEFQEQLDRAYERAGGDVSAIVETVMPSVVVLKQENSEGNLGIGIIVANSDTEIFIATSIHIAESKSGKFNSLNVEFISGEEKHATSYYKDDECNIAVIGVEDITEETMEQIRISTIESSEELQDGDQIIAIGNPVQEFKKPAVSTGMIDGLGDTLIHTDTVTYTEESGGVLLNMQGDFVGVICGSDEEGTLSVPIDDRALEIIEWGIDVLKIN